jgi:exopolysaccharide biosynthesis protein
MLSRSAIAALSQLFAPFVAVGWEVVRTEKLAAPEPLEFHRIELRKEAHTADLHAIAFSTKRHGFAVMDDPHDAFTLATASKKRGALAAVNGGYFHPDRRPLGLVVRQGREIHGLERARLLSGLLVATPKRTALLRVGEFKAGSNISEALQAGPFLVDDGRAVAGLDAVRPAARTVVLGDGSDRFALLISSPVTLAELGAILAAPKTVPAFRVVRALNLDGGSSTGMWVAGEPGFYRRELRSVRNFLGIVPR